MADERKIEFYRHTLGDAEVDSIRATIASLFLTLGPRVGDFEKELVGYLGGKDLEAVAVSSCTVGLFLTMKAFDIGPGDEVITTPMTFAATSNAVIHAGATPVFADIDPRTGLLDPVQVATKITPRTKAVIAVHLYGQLAPMKELRALCDKHGLILIEDSAHGADSERDGVRPGHLGDAAVFSFYATKTMTSGDGGAIVVKDKARADRLRRIRNHGMSRDAAARHGGLYQHWEMMELGYKGAMTDIEAALLLPQFGRLEAQRAARQRVVERYESRLRGAQGVTLVERTGTSAHHLFALLVPMGKRDVVLSALGKRGVGCAVNYRAVHTLKYYVERFGDQRASLPIATDFGERTVSLPLWPNLPMDDVDYVSQVLIDELHG